MSLTNEVFSSPKTKKIRFRDISNLESRMELLLDENVRKKVKSSEIEVEQSQSDKIHDNRSFFDFIKIELTRGYMLEHDEERYSARRAKIYALLKIPRELEKFMAYGVLQCIDSFLYIHTFLPIRYIMALFGIIWRPIARCFGLRRRGHRILAPAETCDLLKGSIWIFSTIVLIIGIDTNRMYHIIKSQSIIKLYIFYNMLEVGDRLFSAFGQDTMDALFWTAVEPKVKTTGRFRVILHLLGAICYIIGHSILILFQATTLNVAINSNNKGLLGIMMSNNFVELKGSVFKKFDKNNLFQLTCSDVRERFHMTILMLVVCIQTMKEFNWHSNQLFVLLPDFAMVLIVELMIDWLKHAFITRFNEISSDVYREYTISLAYDMTQTRQKHAFSDHSDLVARRMGFIPFPLAVVLTKALYSAVTFENWFSFFLLVMAYIALFSCRILNTICTLGKACDLMKEHHDKSTNMGNVATAATPLNNSGVQVISSTPIKAKLNSTTDTATSPVHLFVPLQRSQTADVVINENKSNSSNCGPVDLLLTDANLGATAILSNSDVDLEDVCLNENVRNTSSSGEPMDTQNFTQSVPDLKIESDSKFNTSFNEDMSTDRRTHKRSESEPSIQSSMLDSKSE